MAQSRQGNGLTLEKIAEDFASPAVYRRFYESSADSVLELNPAEESRIEETLTHLPPSCMSALDVGCGMGRLLSRLKNRCACAGADISSKILQRSLMKAVCAQAHIQSLPFASKSFDAVLCTEVLEHIPEDLFPLAIAELRRVARKYILISVPNRENLLEETVSCGSCSLTFHRYGHIRSFTPENLATLFHPMRLAEQWEMGSPKMVWSRFLLRARTMAGFSSVNAAAPCPACGNAQEESPTYVSGLVRKGCDWLQWRVAARLLRRPYWLGVLFAARS
jgi:SAM-dependent methyltransferase